MLTPLSAVDAHPSSGPVPRGPVLGRRLRWGLAILAAAILLGLLEAAQGWFVYRAVPPGLFWPEAVARTMPSWLILAAFTPLLFMLGDRVPIDARRWPVALPLHLLAAAAFTILHLGGSALAATLRRGGEPSLGPMFAGFIARYAVLDVLVYWAIVGSAQIRRHQSELQDRALAASRLEAGLSEARLAALRAQLDPHFLFNALNSIATLARTGERDTLVRMVTALSELLRTMLDTRGATTTLAAELALVDRYLDIQRVRFETRIEVERAIAPEALEAVVPSLLLQPLVENAFVHGVGRQRGAGRVSVRAWREGDRLALEVGDTGPGFPAEVLATQRWGIGLANTATRLEQLHGGAASLTCRNAPGGGACVTIRLPWTPASRLPDPRATVPA